MSNCPLVENQGSGYVIMGYAEGMRKKGHQVDLYGPDDFIPFPGIKAGYRLRLILGYTIRGLCSLLVEKYDVVELWGSEGCFTVGLARILNLANDSVFIAKSNGIEPHCWECTRKYEPRQHLGFITRFFYEVQNLDWVFRLCDGIILVSRFDKVYADRHGYRPHGGILVLANPLKDDWLGLEYVPRKSVSIGFVGKWIERKGCSVMAEMIPALMREIPEAVIWLAGVEQGDNILPEYQKIYGDRLMVYPCISREELKELYLKTSILISPSYYESFGMAVVEAMACGVAVVATKTGYAWELVDGVDCFHMEFGDHADVVEKIRLLLEEKVLLRNVQRNGQMKTRELQWGRNLEEISDYCNRQLSEQNWHSI